MPCEHDHLYLKTLNRKFLFKNIFFLTFLKASFKKFTTCSIDLLLFFIKIKIIKGNESHENISRENRSTWLVVLKQAMDELNEIHFNLWEHLSAYVLCFIYCLIYFNYSTCNSFPGFKI